MADLTHLEKPSYKFIGTFRGLVEDNDDPLDAGRVKLRVFTMHDDPSITVDQLPWAQPALNTFWSGGYNLKNDDVKLNAGSAGYSGREEYLSGNEDG